MLGGKVLPNTKSFFRITLIRFFQFKDREIHNLTAHYDLIDNKFATWCPSYELIYWNKSIVYVTTKVFIVKLDGAWLLLNTFIIKNFQQISFVIYFKSWLMISVSWYNWKWNSIHKIYLRIIHNNTELLYITRDSKICAKDNCLPLNYNTKLVYIYRKLTNSQFLRVKLW